MSDVRGVVESCAWEQPLSHHNQTSRARNQGAAKELGPTLVSSNQIDIERKL